MTNKYDLKFSKEFAVPSVSRKFVAWPAISKALGDVKDKRILELGCGSGYWLRKLAKKGALCTGVDLSSDQIMLAKDLDKTKRIRFIVADATRVKKIGSGFDIVMILNVIVEMGDKRKVHALFKYANKMLAEHGTLFVLDMHPSAPETHGNIRLPKGYYYFRSGAVVGVKARKIDGKQISFHDSHYTLQDFSDFFSQNGFLIKRIIEPQAGNSLVRRHPEISYKARYPSDIIIEGIKHHTFH